MQIKNIYTAGSLKIVDKQKLYNVNKLDNLFFI